MFDIFKYQVNINPYSEDSAPAIRTIAMYPSPDSGVNNICKGVGVAKNYNTSCDDDQTTCKSCCDIIRCDPSYQWCSNKGWPYPNSCVGEGHKCLDTCKLFADADDPYAACVAGITTLNFCTAWDGTYEIDGEFGKSNGQFGFRSKIKTNYPGDGISVSSDLNIEHMIVYPGDSQIPIQVDVTNVHSVRSSPTTVGKAPAVFTQPYKIRYRLSKDAIVDVNIMDPTEPYGSNVVHHLVKGLPRDGEGFQGGVTSGNSPDIKITNEERWDGRDDYGRLLPYGNYLVSIQATSQDEWSGTNAADVSRAVTRQLSLDPLKITDIAVTPLNKQSTSYAMISYLLTEGATVHFEIYTPGTTFKHNSDQGLNTQLLTLNS